jgi:hypothetical protein
MATTETNPEVVGEAFPRGRFSPLPAFGVVGGLLATVVALLGWGAGTEGWRTASGYTARWSLFVFLFLFLADPVTRWFRGPAIRWLKGQDRSLVFAFAGAHFVHLGVILTYFASGGTVPPALVVALGVYGYALVALLVVTSNDRSASILGAKNQRRFHVFVLYYVWLIFALTYAARIAKGSCRESALSLLGVLIASFVMRVFAPLRWPAVRAK